MIFVRDTRDKIGKHDNVDKGLISLGHKVVRTKLFVGDVSLLNNQTICIDLKSGLQEIYGNIISEHQRFVRECKRAYESDIHLVILCEESGIKSVQDVAAWRNPRVTKWEKLRDAHRQGKRMNEQLSPYPPVSSERLCKAMQTIAERYHIEWRFCDKADTARTICEILGIEVDEP